jgi:hypothetical protein
MSDVHTTDRTSGSGQQPAGSASDAAGSLPQSPSESTNESFHAGRWRASFESVIRPLKQDLPHLRNVLEPSRYQRSLIYVFDYSSDMACKRPVRRRRLDFSIGEEALAAGRYVKSLRNNIGVDCTRRLIIVEDICLDLIQVLTVAFALSPEVCEEHLVQSGRTGRYTEPEPQTWKSRRIAKEHMFLRWLRPGRISLAETEETSIYLPPNKVLYHMSSTEIPPDKKGSPAQVRDVKLYPFSNIWRRHLDLRPLAIGALKDHDSIAREERVTVWQRQEDTCLFGMLIIRSTP